MRTNQTSRIISYLLTFSLMLFLLACKKTEDSSFNKQINTHVESIIETDRINDSLSKKFYQQVQDSIAVNNINPSLISLLDSTTFYYDKVKVKDLNYLNEIYKLNYSFRYYQNDVENAVLKIKQFLKIYNSLDNKDYKIELPAIDYLVNGLLRTSDCSVAIDDYIKPTVRKIDSLIKIESTPENLEFLETAKLSLYQNHLSCTQVMDNGFEKIKVLKEIEPLLTPKYKGKDYLFQILDLINNVSDTYHALGDYDKFQLYLHMYENLPAERDAIDKQILMDRYMMHATNVKSDSLFFKYYDESNRIYQTSRNEYPEFSDEYITIAHWQRIAHERKARYLLKHVDSSDKEIATLLHKAIKLVSSFQNDNYINPINAYKNLVEYHLANKRIDSAVFYLNKHLKKSKTLEDSYHIRDNYFLNTLVKIQSRNKDSIIRSLNDYYKHLGISNIDSFINKPELLKETSLSESSVKRFIKLAHSLHRTATNNQDDVLLHKSKELFLLSTGLINQMNLIVNNNSNYVIQIDKINNALVQIDDKLSQLNALNEDDIFKTVIALEQNHSVEIKLKSRLYKNVKNDSVLLSWLSQKYSLEKRIKKISQEQSKDSISQFSYPTLVNDLNNVNQNIEENYPYLSTNKQGQITISSLKSLASQQTSHVYYNGDDGLYLYSVSQNPYTIRLLNNEEFNNINHRTIQSIANKEPLLPTINIGNKQFTNVTITRYGATQNLPLHYLVSNYAGKNISYSLQLQSHQFDGDQRPSSSLIITPSYTNVSNSLAAVIERSGSYSLPFARDEATYISKLFDGTLFIDEDATKEKYIENAPNHNVHHLAMHAVIDEENDYDARLLFQGENDEDFLNLEEIYKLHLNADLVTLSACNTAYGKIDPIEGAMSLSRAFQYAGARATITSLWRVPDRETSIIMKSFYSHLKKGQPKDVALRLAQEEYVSNQVEEEFKHPYYWAGFILTGDTNPIIYSDSPLENLWYVIPFILLLIVLYITLSRKRKKQ